MKKMLIVCCGLFLLGVVACNSTSSQPATTESVPALVERLFPIAMDAVMDTLVKEKERLLSAYPDLARRSIADSITNKMPGMIIDVARRTLKEIEPDLDSASMAKLLTTLAGQGANNQVIQEQASPEQQKYMNKMLSIFQSPEIASKGLPYVIEATQQLDAEIKAANLPEKETETLLCATAVGRSAAQYWSQNTAKWSALFMSPAN